MSKEAFYKAALETIRDKADDLHEVKSMARLGLIEGAEEDAIDAQIDTLMRDCQ